MEREWKSELPESLDAIKDELLRFRDEKGSVIAKELSTRNFLDKWLNFKPLDFPLRHDVLKLIARACACTADRGLHYEFVQQLVSLKASFIAFVSMFLAEVHGQQNTDIVPILKLVFDVIRSIFQCLPVSSMDFLDILLPQVQLILRKSSSEMATELMADITKLSQQGKDISTQENTSQLKSQKEELPPPCDFRDIALLPDALEIESRTKPYLRANVVNGSYKNADHYLDVQFRLLREDMFRYLRESIMEYKSQKWPRDRSVLLQNGRAYFDAKVSSTEYRNGIIFSADLYIGKKVDWGTTKMLMPNSLLCISSDRFRTFSFVFVHSVCPSSRNAFSCHLKFSTVDKKDFAGIDLGKSFDIIETTSFYESYRYVLKRLQSFNAGNFPLSTSLLFLEDCDKQPEYWEKVSVATPFPSKIKKCKFENMLKLPRSKTFDEHQWLAFQLALSNRVSVIQGPPGTGKTYLGLEIVKWLVQNASEHMNAPVLVVCYTNHALDQFLEGALRFTKKVVRIGGQSKNPSLEPHNIHNIVYALLCEIKRRDQMKTSFKNKLCSYCDRVFRPHSDYMCDDFNDDLHGDYCYRSYERPNCCEDCEKRTSESLKIGLQIFGYSSDLDKVSHHTAGIRNTEKALETVKELINDLDAAAIYNEKVVMKLLSENLQNQFLCWSGIFRGKRKPETRFLVRGLENWLCVSVAFLHVYEDLPTFLLLILKEFFGYIKKSGFLGSKISKKKSRDATNNTKIEPGNSFMSGLWDMYLKMNKVACLSTTEIAPADVNNHVQYFLMENVLDRKTVFGFLQKAALKFLEETYGVLDVEPCQIWEHGLLDRWAIFLRWKSDLRLAFLEQKIILYERYFGCLEDREATRILNDTAVARRADIIGLTTTGAAKHWKMLVQISPRVVLVEEAAEVLEAHITTALTKHTQHLILIGDHKQLRPIPSVYDLGKQYKLDVSMFERLLTNGAPSHCLQTQHRMRPCIAELLVPEIYDNLENHPSVLEYENIKGICSNMYFIKHQVYEDSSSDLRSHRNRHEADFLIGLCRYLLQQGYEESQITILTTYVGQLKFLNEAMERKLSYKVRITTVDNFQGEENDIILLSFVRSNCNNSMGFLEISNRICVSLSRARKGMYCIGNFDFFAEKCVVWRKIIKKLKKMKLISSELPLKCQNHPARITRVSRASDFDQVIHGGCIEKCKYRLGCGHNCPLQCHIESKIHAEMCCSKKCLVRCQKKNPNIAHVFENIFEIFSVMKSPQHTEESCNFKNGQYGPFEISGDQCVKETSRLEKESVDRRSNCEKETGEAISSVRFSPIVTSCGRSICFDESEPNDTTESQNNIHGLLQTNVIVELSAVPAEPETVGDHEVKNVLTLGCEPPDTKSDETSFIIPGDVSSLIHRNDTNGHLSACDTCRDETADSTLSSSSSFSCKESRHFNKDGDGLMVKKSVGETDSSELCLSSTGTGGNKNMKHENLQEDLEKILIEDEFSDILESQYNEECVDAGKISKSLFSDTENEVDCFNQATSDHRKSDSQLCNTVILKKLPCQHKIQVPFKEYYLQYNCEAKDEVQLPCLHSLLVTCSDWKWMKEIRCTFTDTLLMPCGKVIQFVCSEGPSHAECTAVVLKCGHRVPCYIDVDTYICDVPMKCILPCSHEIEVPCTLYNFAQNEKLIAACGHPAFKITEKHNALLQRLCSKKCNCVMKCGHTCLGKCGICMGSGKHANCCEIVEKDLPCGHKRQCECHLKDLSCTERCNFLMECGHRCSGNCGVCTRNEKHANCCELVERDLSCGHQLVCECHVKDLCCSNVCHFLMECGHRCLGVCSACMENGEHSVCQEVITRHLPCGHQLESECHIKKPYCPVKCKSVLSCGHECPGDCGQCFEFQIHAMCLQEVDRNLPCGHSLKWACASPLPICERRCLFRCEHSRCTNSCQYPCIKCSKPCEWKCKHFSCSMKCGELCNRTACDAHCPKLLPCGHQCAGYCGEPCPHLCLICDNVLDVNTQGSANRYVLLEDCQHSVLMENLNTYFEQKSPSSCPLCPQCGTVITRNRRFGNCIKSWLASDLHNYRLKSRVTDDSEPSKQPALFARDEHTRMFDRFISDLIYTNISPAVLPATVKMYQNIRILQQLKHSATDLSSDALVVLVKSLEQWLLEHGAVCSEQQVNESCRAVRRLCSLCFLTAHNLDSDPDYSEIITLLDAKPFGESEEKQLMEMLHQTVTKDEGKSNYTCDLLCFISDLYVIQDSPFDEEIDIFKHFHKLEIVIRSFRAECLFPYISYFK